MPWCPKCRQEYREGIAVCAECGSSLVDEEPSLEVELSVLAKIDNEKMAGRLTGFLASEKIEASLEINDDIYTVLVAEKDLKRAKTLFAAFYTVEAENAAKAMKEIEDLKKSSGRDGKGSDNTALADNDNSDSSNLNEMENSNPDTDTASPSVSSSGTYETKAEKGRDLKSSAYTFIGFGIAGFIFMFLNIAGVISLYDNLLAYIVMTVMFTGFIIIGITSFKDSKKALAASLEEEKLTQDIKTFLKNNVNLPLLESYDDPELEAEMNFIKRIEALKHMVTVRYGELDDSYLDAIVEEFYNDTFEDAEEY